MTNPCYACIHKDVCVGRSIIASMIRGAEESEHYYSIPSFVRNFEIKCEKRKEGSNDG